MAEALAILNQRKDSRAEFVRFIRRMTQEEMRLIVKSYITTNADKDRSKMSEEERKLLTILDRARDCGYFSDDNQRYGGHYTTFWFEGRKPFPKTAPVTPPPAPAKPTDTNVN